jgi:hypothetical protein
MGVKAMKNAQSGVALFAMMISIISAVFSMYQGSTDSTDRKVSSVYRETKSELSETKEWLVQLSKTQQDMFVSTARDISELRTKVEYLKDCYKPHK